jgi:hypothetical protein
VQELGAQGVIVSTHDERVHDGPADGGGKHDGGNLRFGSSVGAHEETVEAIQHTYGPLVLREQPPDDGVIQDGADLAASLDGEIDYADYCCFASPKRGWFGFCGVEHGLEPVELCVGDGANDLFLGVVLMIDSSLRHADLISDHLKRRPPDAVLGKQALGRRDDASLGGAGRRRRWWASRVGLSGAHGCQNSSPLVNPQPISYRR